MFSVVIRDGYGMRDYKTEKNAVLYVKAMLGQDVVIGGKYNRLVDGSMVMGVWKNQDEAEACDLSNAVAEIWNV